MMRKWLVVLILLVGSLSAFAVEGKDESRENRELVYKVDIKDEIGPSIWRLVKRSFDRATDENADVILVHMNTYGGMVVYADSLRSLILNYPKPVWVFIDNNAASAGALISIACDRIYMREGANIGAATVVNQTGDAMPVIYAIDDSGHGSGAREGYCDGERAKCDSLETGSEDCRSYGGRAGCGRGSNG